MPLPPTRLQALVPTALGRRFGQAVVRRARATLHGDEHVPRQGAALLVGNHTLFGVDSSPFTALLGLEVGRVPRFLGERNLWRIPGAGRWLDLVGAIPGQADAAVELLRAGELVCVYPGGVDDSFKVSSEAYRLKWGERAGFARVAMRAGAPIVPFAATGIDEIYDVPRRETTLGRLLLGSARYDFPVPRSLVPRSVPLDYWVLPPIDTRGDPESAADVERVRSATFEAVDGVLRRYRESRAAR